MSTYSLLMQFTADVQFFMDDGTVVFETVTSGGFIPRIGEIFSLPSGDYYVLQVRWEWEEYDGHPPNEPYVKVKVRPIANG